MAMLSTVPAALDC